MKDALLSSFLKGARKEAKELLSKFNARDEFPSLMPIDFCTEREYIFSPLKIIECRNQKIASFIAFPFAQSAEISIPTHFRIVSVFWLASGAYSDALLKNCPMC